MLGPDHDVDGGSVGNTGCEELAEWCIRQRPMHFAFDHVDIAEESRGLDIDRRVVDIVGRTALHDAAVAHQGDLVGHAHRLAGFMRDQQHRCAFVLEDRQRLVTDVIAQTVVEARKRLVHQHDPRPRGQRPCQRHALLFAARKLVRVVVDMRQHPDLRQKVAHARAIIPARQTEGHVPPHGQMRKQGEILKHQPDVAGLWRLLKAAVTDQFPVDMNLAAVLRLDTGDDAQGCGLAAAGRPQKARHLPRPHGQADIIDDAAAAKVLDDVPDFKTGGGHGGGKSLTKTFGYCAPSNCRAAGQGRRRMHKGRPIRPALACCDQIVAFSAPPSSTMFWPTMKPACCEHRNAHIAPNSAAVP